MASKSKKKLQFLLKEKSEEINEKILHAKEIHIEDFELKFKETYRTYLEQFPERKILFEYATKLELFRELSETLLFQIVHIKKKKKKKKRKRKNSDVHCL